MNSRVAEAIDSIGFLLLIRQDAQKASKSHDVPRLGIISRTTGLRVELTFAACPSAGACGRHMWTLHSFHLAAWMREGWWLQLLPPGASTLFNPSASKADPRQDQGAYPADFSWQPPEPPGWTTSRSPGTSLCISHYTWLFGGRHSLGVGSRKPTNPCQVGPRPRLHLLSIAVMWWRLDLRGDVASARCQKSNSEERLPRNLIEKRWNGRFNTVHCFVHLSDSSIVSVLTFGASHFDLLGHTRSTRFSLTFGRPYRVVWRPAQLSLKTAVCDFPKSAGWFRNTFVWGVRVTNLASLGTRVTGYRPLLCLGTLVLSMYQTCAWVNMQSFGDESSLWIC